MGWQISRMGQKTLALLLVFALVLPMFPGVTITAKAASVDDYGALVQRLEAAKESILYASTAYGELDFGGGYKLDLKSELQAYAANIDHDLTVAAAIVSGDMTVLGAALGADAKKHNAANFSAAFTDRYAAAVSYLRQGGIAGQKYGGFLGLELQYFFSYKSMLNPGYSASAAITGLKESGKADIVVLAENYVASMTQSAAELDAMLAMLRDYRSEAERLQDYFLTLPCQDETCEHYGSTDCDDWTHRLLVQEADFVNAVNVFKADIDRDIMIVGDLATGRIDSAKWFANKNGQSYYRASHSSLDCMNAAIDFLNNGGFNCGSYTNYLSLYLQLDNQLSYKSNFSDYNVEFSSVLGTGFVISGDSTSVPALVEGALGILRSGATASALDLVYELKVNAINGYIVRAEALRGKDVPPGGSYNQEQFDAAVEDFLTKARRDLRVAAFLVSGVLERDEASTWVATLGDLQNAYADMSEATRYANAVRFFNEGGYGYGYSILGLGYQLEYKSAFHPGYSSGLLGILANKQNAVLVMEDTIAALEKGNRYMTSLELAKYQYEQSLKKLEDIKLNPSGIVAALLKNDAELTQLINDLNLIIGSMDDIINIIETVEKLGISRDILDPILGSVGLSYDTLLQLKTLKETLNGIGIDTSGNVDVRDSMEAVAGGIVGGAIDMTILSAKAAAAFGTESAYKTAAGILDTAHSALLDNAAQAVSTTLAPIVKIVEPIRPYLGMLSSTVSLFNNTLKLVDQVKALQDDLSAGGLSETTYTLADTLDDLANLMVAFGDSKVGEKLAELLNSGALGNVSGTVSGGLADLINNTVNELIGIDPELKGENLEIVGDAANELLTKGLSNPTKLVPLLRSSARILRTGAELLGGVQDVIDGDYESAYQALTGSLSGTLGDLTDLWNSLIGLFDTPTAQAVVLQSADEGLLELQSLNGDEFLTPFVQGVNKEAVDTLSVLIDPSVSLSKKVERYQEFKEFVKEVKTFVADLKSTVERLEAVHDWAKENMSSADAKAFAEKIARHYADKLIGIVKSGISGGKIGGIIDDVKETASELKDILCFIKSTGDFAIDATPATGENTYYSFTTNYDALKAKLEKLLNALGITAAYTVNDPADLFSMEGNLLKSGKALDEGTYSVKVAYKLFFDVCSHDFAVTLATKTVHVTIEDKEPEEPQDPVLTGIEVTTKPQKLGYDKGDRLDLTGMVVTAYYDNGDSRELNPEEYSVSPEADTELSEPGDVTVTVFYEDFEYSFDISVNSTVSVTDLSVTPPARLTYTVGDSLDLTGMGVVATFDYINVVIIFEGQYSVSPRHGARLTESGRIEVVVSCGGISKSFYIEVSEVPIPKDTYTVTFNPNGGSLAAGSETSKTVDDGDSIVLPAVSARSDHSFDGWYDGDTLAGAAGASYRVTKTVTLSAKWTYTGGGSPGTNPGAGEVVILDDDEIPLAGGLTLMSLAAGSADGIVYYLDDAGATVYVPFCFVIGDKIYFLGQSGVDYFVKSNPKTFEDIGGHWAYESILPVVSREVFLGYPDDSFRPNGTMTRGMFASVMARMAMADTSKYTKQIFGDVSPDTWYGPAVAWAFDNGIITGKDEIFDPEASITRQEMAAMLSRFLRYMGVELEEKEASPFADINAADSWAVDAILDMQRFELMDGKDHNRFDPDAESTRGEIATILRRMIQTVITSEYNSNSEELKGK